VKLSIASALTLLNGSAALAIEEPKYEVVKEFERGELRQYAPTLIAETTVTGSFDEVGNEAFRILAGYIQGENVKAEEIEMTAPVNQRPTGAESQGEKSEMTAPVSQTPAEVGDASGTYVLSFVLPWKYTLQTLPKPKDDRVNIREVPGRMVAAIRYTGSWDRKRYLENEKRLIEAIQKEGLVSVGPPIFARYNPPLTPSFLRRNEVLIDVTGPVGKKGE